MPRSRDDELDDEDDRPRRRRRPADDEDDYEADDDRPRRRRRPDPMDDPALRFVILVNTSPWAIAAGYLGLFAVLCVPAPLALGCGIMAVREIRRDPKKHGMGRAVFGIVMGGLGTGLLALGLASAAVNGK